MEIKIVRDVLEENENLADEVQKVLRAKRQSMFNFMSAPGSGKTSLLEKLIPALQKKGFRVGVIEGDITTTNDAQRLQPLNIPIAQINTEYFGGDCHLGAHVVFGGLNAIQGSELDIVLLENVGNLVCPAEFKTGSDANIVLLSITEGEDKPLKYPLMFRKSHLALINKVDLNHAVEANISLIKTNLLKVNRLIDIKETSARNSQGINEVADWIIQKHKKVVGESAGQSFGDCSGT